MDNRPELTANISRHMGEERGGRIMLSIVGEKKLRRILSKLLDETSS